VGPMEWLDKIQYLEGILTFLQLTPAHSPHAPYRVQGLPHNLVWAIATRGTTSFHPIWHL
jgi:hypothetical protein